MAQPRRDPETCRICGRHYSNHTPCPACGDALEHTERHPDGITTEEEWEGLARMARAGKAARRPLTNPEREALERYPHPAVLTAEGYRRPDRSRPPWAGH